MIPVHEPRAALTAAPTRTRWAWPLVRPRRAAHDVDETRRQGRAREGEPHVVVDARRPEGGDGEGDGEGRSRVHPQQPGLGQRVARQRLHGDSREGEARPDDDGQRRARHARLPDDDGLGDLPPVPSGGGQPAPHFAERERFGSDGDADHGQPGEHGQACDPDGDGAPAPEARSCPADASSTGAPSGRAGVSADSPDGIGIASFPSLGGSPPPDGPPSSGGPPTAGARRRTPRE